jgi:hypothetical protein
MTDGTRGFCAATNFTPRLNHAQTAYSRSPGLVSGASSLAIRARLRAGASWLKQIHVCGIRLPAAYAGSRALAVLALRDGRAPRCTEAAPSHGNRFTINPGVSPHRVEEALECHLPSSRTSTATESTSSTPPTCTPTGSCCRLSTSSCRSTSPTTASRRWARKLLRCASAATIVTPTYNGRGPVLPCTFQRWTTRIRRVEHQAGPRGRLLHPARFHSPIRTHAAGRTRDPERRRRGRPTRLHLHHRQEPRAGDPALHRPPGQLVTRPNSQCGQAVSIARRRDTRSETLPLYAVLVVVVDVMGSVRRVSA